MNKNGTGQPGVSPPALALHTLYGTFAWGSKTLWTYLSPFFSFPNLFFSMTLQSFPSWEITHSDLKPLWLPSHLGQSQSGFNTMPVEREPSSTCPGVFTAIFVGFHIFSNGINPHSTSIPQAPLFLKLSLHHSQQDWADPWGNYFQFQSLFSTAVCGMATKQQGGSCLYNSVIIMF